MPHGRALAPEVWLARHRIVLALVWIHAAVILVWAAVSTGDVPHALVEASPLALAGVVAGRASLSQSVRSAVATAGLFTASAIGVHLSGGYIEAHFHFFVMVGVVTLYHDWVPFGVALGITVIHHATVGVLQPAAVYNHSDAVAHPVLWAVLHGAFVLAAAATHVFSWRVSEERFRDPVTQLANRGLFEIRLEQRMHAPGAQRHPTSVLFVDLDDFKSVNDDLGMPRATNC